MIFSQSEIQEVLNVIEYHHVFVAYTNLGVTVLSDDDRQLLLSHGIDIDDLKRDLPFYDRMYYFGKLTAILRDSQAMLVTADDFLQYIKRGQYIPLSTREKFELDIAKRKTYTHLKGLKERVKSSVETSILEQEAKRQLYEQTVKEGMIEGVQNRKSVQNIVSDIGHKMQEWKHDWGRICETEMNNIFQMGRAAQFAAKEGDDVLVYKTVYEGACRHCIEKYLTEGVGSKPRVFKLSTLIKNGTNIGKKVKQWLAVLSSMHPFCRCNLMYVPKRYVWSDENKRFELPKVMENRVERKSKVYVAVGDKNFEV